MIGPKIKKYAAIICGLILCAAAVVAQERPAADLDTPMKVVQYAFNGSWLPMLASSQIGPENFKTLQNMRYNRAGIEGVNGYSKINTTALSETVMYSGNVNADDDWIEVDDTSSITIESYTITVATVDSDDRGHVYMDLGVDGADESFKYEFDFKPTESTLESVCAIWAIMSEDTGLDVAAGPVDDAVYVWMYSFGGSPYMGIFEYHDGVSNPGDPITIVDNTQYYVTVERTVAGTYGSVTLSVYSDSAKTTHIDGSPQTIALAKSVTYRYLYAMSTNNGGATTGTVSFVIANLKASQRSLSGIQFNDIADTSYVATHLKNYVGDDSVKHNETDIPDQGDFESPSDYTPTKGCGKGRFSQAPRGITYANEKESCVWAGDEMPLAAAFLLNDVTLVSDQITLTETTNPDTIGYTLDSFIDLGFKVGQNVTLSGSGAANDGTYEIVEIATDGNTIYLADGDLTADEAAGVALTLLVEDDKNYWYPIDVTEAVNNELDDEGNVVTIGGGIDSTVTLLLNFDGTDGSTTITDESASANGDASVYSNAQLDTSSKKFGSASLYLPETASGDCIAYTDADAVFNFGTAAMTIDFWVKYDETVFGGGETDCFFSQYDDATHLYLLQYNGSYLTFTSNDGGKVVTMSPYYELKRNVWYHLAVIKGWGNDTDNVALCANGNLLAVDTSGNGFANLANQFLIGSYHFNANTPKCHIDGFRVTKGVARWTEEFTPPERPTIGTHSTRWLLLTSRPAQGFEYYIKSPNTQTAATTCKVWTGKDFEAVTLTDNTASGGKALAQDGTMTFNSTVDFARPLHFEGTYFYGYMFETSAGFADIYHITADCPFQKVVDLWDGVYRQPIQFQVYRASTGKYEDFTFDVNYQASTYEPIGANLDGLTSSDHIIVGFDEKMSAVDISMLGNYVNADNAGMTWSRWDGIDWNASTRLVDATVNDYTATTMNKSGLVDFDEATGFDEEPQHLFGSTGYFYKIAVDDTFTGTYADTTDEVLLDTIWGIPSQLTVLPFRFPSWFKNRTLLCGYTAGNEGNRVDFSMTNTTEAWNGEESSMDGLQSLYFGNAGDIMAGGEIFNRYGSNIFDVWLGLKKSSTYILHGSGPDDYVLYPVSLNIGCPAPMSFITAELGYEVAADVQRNVAIWVDYSGPILFDGAVIVPVTGIENYFDPVKTECVNYGAFENLVGWYDTTWGEYNLLLPSGANQNDPNVWLVYSMKYKKWYEKVPPSYPLCGFQVIDTDGARYAYGGFGSGYMRRLENGTTWDSTEINQVVETGDFWPTNNTWDWTQIRRFKLVSKDLTEAADCVVTHYSDTESSGTALTTIDLDEGNGDLNFDTIGVNVAARTHRFHFSVSTTTEAKGFQPLYWGYQYRVLREDLE